MRIAALLASATVVVLSIVSTTFVYLSLQSTEWSTQSYYFAINAQSDGTNDTSAACTAGRSPFYRCGIPTVDVNGTCNIPSCSFYKAYGSNATSCRSAAELGIASNDDVSAGGLLGGDMECQQGKFARWTLPLSLLSFGFLLTSTLFLVHYAGNLQIAACVFITLGLVSGLVLLGLSVSPRSTAAPEEVTAGESAKEHHGRHHHHQGHHHHPETQSRGPAPFVVFALQLFLLIGAILQFLAQFFGVLGLTVNATPNGASAALYQYQVDDNNFVAHDWVIGKGMGAYATTAWTTALASAFLAGSVFTMPSFPKYL
jgi:hypothetical protein